MQLIRGMFGYNYGPLKSSASHACHEMTVLKKCKKCRKLHLFAAMTVTFRLACRAVRNVPCAVTFLISTQVSVIGLLPVSYTLHRLGVIIIITCAP